MTPEDLSRLYTTFRHSAWRLETRDVYAGAGDDEDFDDFLAGRPVTARTVDNSLWLANVAATRAEGKFFGRVRLVGHPVTDYTRFEFASYPENICAGEEVRILDRDWLSPEDEEWSCQDFWLFDDEVAVRQRYSDEGRFLGVEQANDVRPYVAIARRAEALSVPFQAYHLIPGPRRPTRDLARPQVGTVDH